MLAGQREKKKAEPKKEMAHQDFLLEEMRQVALDVHEEHFYKRSMLARLAVEAKIAWIQREERKVQKLQQNN